MELKEPSSGQCACIVVILEGEEQARFVVARNMSINSRVVDRNGVIVVRGNVREDLFGLYRTRRSGCTGVF